MPYLWVVYLIPIDMLIENETAQNAGIDSVEVL